MTEVQKDTFHENECQQWPCRQAQRLLEQCCLVELCILTQSIVELQYPTTVVQVMFTQSEKIYYMAFMIFKGTVQYRNTPSMYVCGTQGL